LAIFLLLFFSSPRRITFDNVPASSGTHCHRQDAINSTFVPMTENVSTTFPHLELTALAIARSTQLFVPMRTENLSTTFPHPELTVLAFTRPTHFFVPMTENVSSTFPHAVLTIIADTRPTFHMDLAPPLRVAPAAVPKANTHGAAPHDANGFKRLLLLLYYARRAFDPGIYSYSTSHHRQIMVHIPPY
jgi:hypothetical protein